MQKVMEEREAIRELIARYCFLVDAGRFEEWAELFTDDGVFEGPGSFRFEGRAAILEFIRKVPLNDRGLPGFKHCTLNQAIDVAGDRATAECYLILIREGDPLQVEIAGRYEDALRKRNGKWLFHARKVHFDFGRLAVPKSASTKE